MTKGKQLVDLMGGPLPVTVEQLRTVTQGVCIIFLQKMFARRGPARNFPEVRTVASFPNDISRA